VRPTNEKKNLNKSQVAPSKLQNSLAIIIQKKIHIKRFKKKSVIRKKKITLITISVVHSLINVQVKIKIKFENFVPKNMCRVAVTKLISKTVKRNQKFV
jgi:hypothetical protein